MHKPRLVGIHTKIADDVYPNGTRLMVLRCGSCGKQRSCTKDDFACYLRNGWPKCCGSTMELKT